ncbi:transcriptional regulator [Psychrobacillus glaciei]|nr:transcriptional regulator [Psychrobacillus glaciei]
MRINILKYLYRGQLADMIYMKNRGEMTKRRVKIVSVEDTTFKVYCFLRNTKRTFKIENILAFVPIANHERDVI